MADREPHASVPDGEWLRERPPADHLESDESLRHVLTNRAVGVEREGDEETVQLAPGDDHGALAIVTDRRLLLLVGDCPEREGDVAMPIPHEVVTTAEAETETLTERLVVETEADVAWAFTAREAGDAANAATFIADASDAWQAVEANLDAVEDARDRLENALEDDDWAAADEAIADARDGLGPMEAALADVAIDRLEEQVDPLAGEVDELAALRHRRAADTLADEAEAALADFEYQAGHERLQDAAEHAEQAAALVENEDEAIADGGATVAATVERIEDLRADLGRRPLSDAAAHHQRAVETEDETERIDALEDAFACYRNAASLVAAPDSPFEGDEAAAREDAVAVIEELLEARTEAAEKQRAAAEWEADTDHPKAAYELYVEARDHLDRAVDLAEEYPPGDPEELRATLEDVESAMDPLEIKVQLEAQNEEQGEESGDSGLL